MEGIFFIIFMAIGVGAGLIFLLALSDKNRKKTTSPNAPQGMSQSEFEKACVRLVEGMKLEIEEISRTSDLIVDIIARSPIPITGGQFLVRCLYAMPEQMITPIEIIELSNMVLQERLSKGIFITTGQFTKDIPTIGELAPMEYIDGDSLEQMLKKYRPV